MGYGGDMFQKKKLVLIAMAFIMICFNSDEVLAEIGCRVRNAREPQGSYIHCSCPCERYKTVSRREQCMQCLHYRRPRDMF